MKFANAFLIAVAGMLGGCGMSGDDPVERTGLALGVEIEPTEGELTLRYTIHQVACQGETITSPISDIVRDVAVDNFGDPGLPGGAPGLAHQFGDELFVLPAGCYDVEVEAILADGSLCGPALAQGLRVEDGLTTERLLILQCPSKPNGGLDGATLINQAPALQEIDFRPSKFLFECEASAVVCARAIDLDGDPLHFAWGTCGARSFFQPLSVVERRLEPNTGGLGPSTVECVNVVPQLAGDYCIDLVVHDTMRDASGQVVPIENVLDDVEPGLQSHDALQIPIHSMSDVPLLCKRPSGELDHLEPVRSYDRVPGCAFSQPPADFEIPACE